MHSVPQTVGAQYRLSIMIKVFNNSKRKNTVSIQKFFFDLAGFVCMCVFLLIFREKGGKSNTTSRGGGKKENFRWLMSTSTVQGDICRRRKSVVKLMCTWRRLVTGPQRGLKQDLHLLFGNRSTWDLLYSYLLIFSIQFGRIHCIVICLHERRLTSKYIFLSIMTLLTILSYKTISKL